MTWRNTWDRAQGTNTLHSYTGDEHRTKSQIISIHTHNFILLTGDEERNIAISLQPRSSLNMVTESMSVSLFTSAVG